MKLKDRNKTMRRDIKSLARFSFVHFYVCRSEARSIFFSTLLHPFLHPFPSDPCPSALFLLSPIPEIPKFCKL